MASQIPNAAISPFNSSRSYDELIRLSGRPRSDVGFMTALKVVDALITPELSPATARLQASPVKPTFSGWMRKQARSFPYALQSKWVTVTLGGFGETSTIHWCSGPGHSGSSAELLRASMNELHREGCVTPQRTITSPENSRKAGVRVSFGTVKDDVCAVFEVLQAGSKDCPQFKGIDNVTPAPLVAAFATLAWPPVSGAHTREECACAYALLREFGRVAQACTLFSTLDSNCWQEECSSYNNGLLELFVLEGETPGQLSRDAQARGLSDVVVPPGVAEGCKFHVPKPYQQFVPARRRSLTTSGTVIVEASAAASSSLSHAGTWVDWCTACTHGSGRIRTPHWSCCGALEEDARCAPGQIVAPLSQELLSEFEAVLTAAESARLVSIVNAGRLRENIRVGYFDTQQATVAMNAYRRQLAELHGAEAPAATAGNSGSLDGEDALAGARGALSNVGTWISNAFQSGAASAESDPALDAESTAAAAAAAESTSGTLPTSADTRRFVSSIRNLRDIAQDAPADEEASTEGEAAVKSLPYGGNIGAAMKANDRDAIKKIMAHRNAAPKAAAVPEPSEAPEPPPAPRSMPRFLRQISANGNNMSFKPILAEPSEDDANNPEAAGELEEGEVAADEVEELCTLTSGDQNRIGSDTPKVWFSTAPFTGALASAVVTGVVEVANVKVVARRGSGAQWIPLKTWLDVASLHLELTLPAELLTATTDKVPKSLEVGLLQVASGLFAKSARFCVVKAHYAVTVHAVKPTPRRIRIKLPATAQPGQLLKVAVPGSTGANLQVKVPPNAVPGSTIEFNVSSNSSAVALPPAGFPLRVVNMNVPTLSASRTQWTKLRVPIPAGPTRPSGVSASAVVMIPPHLTPSGIIKLKVAEVLSPPTSEGEGDGSLVWKRAQLEARLAPLRIKWQDGRVDIKVARKTFLQSALDALPRKDEDWRKTWRFKFEGEPGIDAGGVAREFWSMISAELFSPHAGLFKYSATDQLTYQINPLAPVLHSPEAAKALFGMVGRLLGKALLDNQLVTATLNRPLLKHLLAIPIAFSDLEQYDASLHKNLNWILNCGKGEVDALCQTFTATVEDVGGVASVDLMPGGSEIDVTDANKVDFVIARFKFRMMDRIAEPLAALLKGFYAVVPLDVLKGKSKRAQLDAEELEVVLCGDADIDVADWKAHTSYGGGLSATRGVGQMFWSVVENDFSNEQRTRLIQFVTGTSRIPAGGFKHLQGVDGKARRFELLGMPGGDHATPRAHTCFNRLDLPTGYSSASHMRTVLTNLVAGNVEGFSMD